MFEASGNAEAFSQALAAADRGAKIIQIWTLPTPLTTQLNTVMAKELSLLGSFRFANVFATSLDLVASQKI